MDHTKQLSKHRIEALTDGIFAVAMTLLVIELRLPDHGPGDNEAALVEALRHLVPNFVSWVISFFVLALFWIGHHRLFHYVRHVDGRLLAITTFTLAGASLLPFASAANGHFPSFAGQVVYSLVMAMMGLAALMTVSYLKRHPELCVHPLPLDVYGAARFRTCGIICVAVLAVAISYAWPGKNIGNIAFLLLAFLRPLGERVGRRYAGKHSPLQ